MPGTRPVDCRSICPPPGAMPRVKRWTSGAGCPDDDGDATGAAAPGGMGSADADGSGSVSLGGRVIRGDGVGDGVGEGVGVDVGVGAGVATGGGVTGFRVGATPDGVGGAPTIAPDPLAVGAGDVVSDGVAPTAVFDDPVGPDGDGLPGTPNSPTAIANDARTRFRIPSATTSRARWEVVKSSVSPQPAGGTTGGSRTRGRRGSYTGPRENSYSTARSSDSARRSPPIRQARNDAS
jgi:hypothetical protein